jgi:hypothetical protein
MKITKKEIEALLWVLRELLTVLLQLKKNKKKNNEKEQD